MSVHWEGESVSFFEWWKFEVDEESEQSSFIFTFGVITNDCFMTKPMLEKLFGGKVESWKFSLLSLSLSFQNWGESVRVEKILNIVYVKTLSLSQFLILSFFLSLQFLNGGNSKISNVDLFLSQFEKVWNWKVLQHRICRQAFETRRWFALSSRKCSWVQNENPICT